MHSVLAISSSLLAASSAKQVVINNYPYGCTSNILLVVELIGTSTAGGLQRASRGLCVYTSWELTSREGKSVPRNMYVFLLGSHAITREVPQYFYLVHTPTSQEIWL